MKKFTCLAIAVLMLLSALAGCGNRTELTDSDLYDYITIPAEDEEQDETSSESATGQTGNGADGKVVSGNTKSSANTRTTKSDSKVSSKKITLTVSISQKELGDLNIFAEYEKSHPNVQINEVPVSNSDTKLIAMISSGSAPDILRCMGFDELPVFVERGLLMPLDNYIKKSGKFNLKDLYEINSMYRFDGKTRGKGQLYGMAKDWSPTGIWINKQAFEETSIPLPSQTTPMTWAKFADTAQALVKKNGETISRHGVITALAMPTLVEMKLNSIGKSLWSSDFNKTTLLEADSKNTVAYWQNLQKTGALSGPLYPASDTIGHSAILENKVGMVLAGYWLCGSYRLNNTIKAASEKLMFVPAPSDGGQKSYCFDLTGAGIFSQTKHPKEAYDLWEYLMIGDYSVTKRAEIGFGVPAVKSYFSKLPKATEFDKATLNVVNTQIATVDMTPKINPYISYASLTALFDKYFVPVLFNKSTLDEALTTIDKEATLLVSEGKDLVGID